MTANADILRGELERHFELDELKKLSHDLLGLDPAPFGPEAGKAAFARALVERCAIDDALDALADAMALSSRGAAEGVARALTTRPGALEPGAAVGPYVVERRLRATPFGTLYLAATAGATNGAGAHVAISVVDGAPDRGAGRRYLTVARALRGQRVPGMAAVLEVGELAGGRPWVAWEHVDGPTLAEHVRRSGPLSVDRAIEVARTVIEALAVLHQRGVVHGGVAPERVVVGDAGATLVDPGTDRLLPRGGAGEGTLGLLAVVGGGSQDPALFGRGRAATTTDVYGAGLVLYTALAGRPPFVGEHALEVAMAHLSRLPQAPSTHALGVPSAVDDVVLKALEKEPADRFADAEALLEALENALAGSPSVRPSRAPELDTKAFDAAVAALRQSPGNEDAANAVERAVAPSHAYGRAVDAFLSIAEQAKDRRATRALRLRAARLQHTELRDGAAAEATYRALLEADPNDGVAMEGLVEAMRSAKHWDELVELLLERAESQTSPASRASTFRQLGEVYEHELGDAENAFVAYLHALGDDPRNERLALAVERLGTTAERWQEATAALTESAQGSEDPSAQVALYLRLGRWYAGKLQRPDLAVQCYGQALAIDPSTEEAYEATTDLYRRSQAWNELATVLVQRADATANPARARDLRAEAALVLKKRLGDAFRSATLLRGVLDEDPAHPVAASALEEVLTDKGDWEGLVEHLERRAQYEQDQARADTMLRVAELYEDRLDDLDKAGVLYESVAATNPTSLPALKGLERIHARKGDNAALLEALQQQLVVAPTPRQKIQLHERVGSLLEEEFVDREKAAFHFEKIVAIDPANEGANAALARLYRQLERWDALAETYQRHAGSVDQEARAVSLLLRAVEVLEKHVGAPDRALELADRAVALDGTDATALSAVARLRGTVGDQRAAVAALDKLVAAEPEPAKKAALAVEAGDILAQRGDRDGAIERYKTALDAEPSHPAAFAALRRIFAERGDARGEVDLLDREIAVTDGELQKARLFAAKGRVLRERLDDLDGALAAYANALRLDATSTDAAMGLGDLAHGAHDWPKVAEYYEPLLARTDGMEPELATRVAVRAGDAFRELGMPEKAQRAYLTARSFAPNDPEIAERVAEASLAAGDAEEAAELYRELFERFGGELTGRHRGLALLRQGQALLAIGRGADAEPSLVEAAELLPEDLAPLEGLRVIYTDAERWHQVLDVVQRGLERAITPEARFELRLAAGDVLADGLGKRDEAAEQYVKALELRGNHRGLLGRLMNVYSDRGDWPRLLDTVVRIAEIVEEPRVQAKYWSTAGAIAQHETHDLDDAVGYYRRALEGDPTLRESFQALVECLEGDVDAQLAAHERQIERLALVDASPADRAFVWDSHAVVLERAGRMGEAVDALTRAQELDPSNRERTQRLARALASGAGDRPERAIEAHRSLLAENPYRVESYRALLDLLGKANRNDEAWAVAQGLRAIGNAEPADDALFQRHRPSGPAYDAAPLGREAFDATLRHAFESPIVTGIFACVQPAVITARGRDAARLGLTQADVVDPGASAATRALRGAAKVLGVELPTIFRRSDDPGAFGVLPTQPPAIGVGKAAEAGGPEVALAFVAGRHLSYFRPGALVRQLVPTAAGLRGWLLSGIKVVAPRFPVPDELAHTVHEQHALVQQSLRGPARDLLYSLVERLLETPELDVRRWMEGVDLTADRAGLAVADDLSIAVAIVKASDDDVAAVPTPDRLHALHAYAVSGAYADLRRRLGIAGR